MPKAKQLKHVETKNTQLKKFFVKHEFESEVIKEVLQKNAYVDSTWSYALHDEAQTEQASNASNSAY